ncbi:hypothetical protein EC973_007311 [Apophysomyces ossiformis]|uniref:Septin-type G domain-containing protein n=1 Tax=Apophysomyces ossiformis TaxID=679940 RepID=A0A8H7BQ22_9FUNG|nr:hypothetical protein EC973_007311 [Apophysomyces ossiformis]
MSRLAEFHRESSVEDDCDSLALPSMILEQEEDRLDDDLHILQPDDIRECFLSTAKHASQERLNEEFAHEFRPYSKNICFIDTPGYGSCLDASDVFSSVTSYIERQFVKTNSMLNPACPDTANIVRLMQNSSGAHTHVDACLYLVLGRLKKVDIEYLRALDGLCNVIPVIMKSDQLSQDRERELRVDILQELRVNDIEIFDFGYTFDELMEMGSKLDPSVPPFALSSLEISTKQLTCLKDALLYTHIDELRQATAEKFVEWRQSQVPDVRSVLDLSMLTTAESIDRIHAVRKRATQSMNLRISQYMSERRRSLERSMYEREEALKRELGSVEGRKRATMLVNELNKLLQDESFDIRFTPSTASSASTLTTVTLNNSDLLFNTKHSNETVAMKESKKSRLGFICFALLMIVSITGFPFTLLCRFPSITWLPICGIRHGQGK